MTTRLETLSAEECRELLERGVVGRVAITAQGIPEVLPVNYTLIDGNIVFRAGRGTVLHGSTSDAPIAFEVDQSDPATLSGWSVLVVGFSKEVTDRREVDRALAILPDGWVPHEHEHVIRLQPIRVSGRRILRSDARDGQASRRTS